MCKGNEKKKRFVEEYFIDMNAARAARAVGYSEKTAYAAGNRLLKDAYVQAELQKMREQQQMQTGITAERVLAEYAKIAFVDVRQFFYDTGALRPVSEWTEEMAACIGGLEVVEHGDEGALLKKIKLIDRKQALDSLARHLGLFKDKVEISVDETLAERLARAKARLEK